MKKYPYLPLLAALLFLAEGQAQFLLEGEFRPRAEYRSGYGNLLPDTTNAGFGISSRLRLIADYKTEAYRFHWSLQDVMVWGENPQLFPADQNHSLSFFEAWAGLQLGNQFSARLGRQVLSYDDQRILGEVDWTQQARNHDAAVISYMQPGLVLDLGLAFNQDYAEPSGFQSEGTTYHHTGSFSYKSMQYLYGKKQWKKVSASLLFLNTGFQNLTGDGEGDGQSYLQTMGTHLNYHSSSFGATANAFIQTGRRPGKLEVDGAYLLGIDLSYSLVHNVILKLGAERISGDRPGSPNRTEAFFPLYGTNHKFNGFMDYFYVGNHGNTVGLQDLHAGASLGLGKQASLQLAVLRFAGEQELPAGNKYLATEIDLVFAKKVKGYLLTLGYSHLFPAEGMYDLKGIPEDNTAGNQYWAWAMITLKPQFLDNQADSPAHD